MAEDTATALAALRAARNLGVKTVTEADGRSTTYQSLADLDAAIARLEAKAGTQSAMGVRLTSLTHGGPT